jgi:hypothetical protein
MAPYPQYDGRVGEIGMTVAHGEVQHTPGPGRSASRNPTLLDARSNGALFATARNCHSWLANHDGMWRNLRRSDRGLTNFWQK